jgi:hypothetical protein
MQMIANSKKVEDVNASKDFSEEKSNPIEKRRMYGEKLHAHRRSGADADPYSFFASQPRPQFEDLFCDTMPQSNRSKKLPAAYHSPVSVLAFAGSSPGGKASLHKPVGNEKGGMPIRPWASGTCASVRTTV